MSSPIKNGVSSIAVVVYRRVFPLPSWAAPTLVTCNSAEVGSATCLGEAEPQELRLMNE